VGPDHNALQTFSTEEGGVLRRLYQSRTISIFDLTTGKIEQPLAGAEMIQTAVHNPSSGKK
jgi:hypothetical protein